MITKEDLREKGFEIGFADIGFCNAEPFEKQKEILNENPEGYSWASKWNIDLFAGTDPQHILEGAKSIIVVLDVYFKEKIPKSMESHFGRCYIDDDRLIKQQMSLRFKEFRNFLREKGIKSSVPFNLSHRSAAVRAGLGSTGKNCLFYANNAALGSSFVSPVAFIIDKEIEPDPAPATDKDECPSWCRNACVAACPTGALKGRKKIEPRRCISYLTYIGDEITPMELREPMGLAVYGCDRCQEVCPRNAPFLAKELPESPRLAERAENFRLEKLISMDEKYFTEKIFPVMFYMPPDRLWKWKMNAARAMGNTRDTVYIKPLAEAFESISDERTLGMIAWAMGKIGGPEARRHLEKFNSSSIESALVRDELKAAIENSGV